MKVDPQKRQDNERQSVGGGLVAAPFHLQPTGSHLNVKKVEAWLFKKRLRRDPLAECILNDLPASTEPLSSYLGLSPEGVFVGLPNFRHSVGLLVHRALGEEFIDT